MDLVVGEILYISIPLQNNVFWSGGFPGQEKVKFSFTAVQFQFAIYKNLKDEKKAKTDLDYIGAWRNKTNLQKRSQNTITNFRNVMKKHSLGLQ